MIVATVNMVEYPMTKIPLVDKDLIIVTDIHGNFEDFQFYLNLWLKDTDNHICFTGDLIHADSIEEDDSLKILELVRVYIDYPTFHCLMGNHELSQLFDDECYKYNVNQVDSFKRLVQETYPKRYTEKYAEYMKLLQQFHISLMTSNGLFIIHSGINEDYLKPLITNSVDIHHNIDFQTLTDYDKETLTETLWARHYDDYTTDTIDKFLKHTKSKIMISGHTIVNGYKIFGKQLIFDSSYNTQKKYYIQIPLNKKNINITNITSYLKQK